MKNYYEILGVKEDATQEEIRNAYYALIKNYHPNGDGETADQDKFKEIFEAYKVLGKVANRKEYDKKMFDNAESFEYGEDVEDIDPYANDEEKKSKIKVFKNTGDFLKKHSYALVTGALVVGCLIVGYLIGKGPKSTPQEPQTIVDTIDDEEPTQELEETKLTAENFDETVQNILEDNQNSGLNIDPTFVKSALFITNIDYLDQEDTSIFDLGLKLDIPFMDTKLQPYISLSAGIGFVSIDSLDVDNEIGLGYGIGAGVKYTFNDNMYVKIGLEYSGASFSVDVYGYDADMDISGFGLTTGLGYRF